VNQQQLAQYEKIWMAYSKMVKLNLDHGKVVDSLYFGWFSKKTTES
jgi:hypothetical protein